MNTRRMGRTNASITSKPSISEAKLDDGKIVNYAFCSDSRDSKYGKDRRYLGRGTIYSINGHVQTPGYSMKHFWGEISK